MYPWRCTLSAKIVWYWWLLHILCNLTSTKISEYFKFFAQRSQKLEGKKCPKLAKDVSCFFKFPEKLLFGRVSTGQTFFNDYAFCYTSIGTQVRARHLDHICSCKRVKVPKNDKNVLKTGYTNTLAPRNPSRHSQITFFQP